VKAAVHKLASEDGQGLAQGCAFAAIRRLQGAPELPRSLLCQETARHARGKQSGAGHIVIWDTRWLVRKGSECVRAHRARARRPR